MPVEDVFRLQQDRGVVAAGRIERGRVRKDDTVDIIGASGSATAHIAGIEQNHVSIGEAKAEMNVGVLLRGMAADAVERGQVLAASGSVSAHTGFTADITLLSEEQGGADVVSGDRLRFYARTAAVWGTVTLPEGADVVRPLHGAEVTVVLDEPVVPEEGQSFARRSGQRGRSGAVALAHSAVDAVLHTALMTERCRSGRSCDASSLWFSSRCEGGPSTAA
ncbi:EF-Tu/IF-2/RF-3 family GTPase [Streptomyces sp. IBSNAI002]|uniref:EF-Tu/IF-2/RF-3 family GTPase n=1 Tax=Streptomyces sp. IBSNAI002 TaxID=3457500 RepID=UPI003FD35C74